MGEKDENISGNLPTERHLKTDSGEPLTPVEETARDQIKHIVEGLARDHLQSPAVKLARDYLDSPAAKLISDFTNSPTQQIAKQALLGVRPNLGIAAEIAGMEEMRRALEPPASLASQLSALSAITLPTDALMIKAIEGIQPVTIDPAFGRALQEAHKPLEDAMRQLGGIRSALKLFEEHQSAVQKSLVASLAGPLGDIARTGQWVSALGKINTFEFASLLGGSLGTAVDNLRSAIDRNFTGAIAADQVKMSTLLGLNTRLEAEFETTRLKMSALAGIGEMFDPSSNLRMDAYHSLFGDWRSSPDLPEKFWHDARIRKRMYREAEVDEGLIAATPGVAVEIMIESGLTAGLRSDANAVAVFALGEVSMTIRSRGTRKDAYAALERFEQELRAYISRKLEEQFGPDWFKVRASNLIGKAKVIRKAAMERGETFAPLIEFVELGELAGIILSPKNWDEIFGDVFINRAAFDHDMQKLIAARRPTMHIRPIDGVRLVEMLCVMQRLSEQMADDGAWKIAAESDR
ncbi:Swt1 family HEPN domain-containing protein [Roseibium sp. RP-7]